MATQTVTVSSAPADYSLSDLDLLESPDAAAETPAASADAPPAAAAGTEEGTKTADQRGTDEATASESADKKLLPEFDGAFELPGIGPKLREICERDAEYREVFPTVADARAVREIFSTPEAARAAATAQADLARLDGMVESRDPRAHAELLADIQRNSPQAFRELAFTFGERLAALDPEAHQQVSAAMAAQALAAQRWPEHVALLSRAVEQQDWPAVKFLAATLSSNLAHWPAAAAAPVYPDAGRASRRPSVPLAPLAEGNATAAQPGVAAPPQTLPAAAQAANQFLESVNAGVEQAVQASVAGKVAELLPDAPEGARQKIAGEIFRELDQTLRQDPELLDQVREAVRNALREGISSRPQPVPRLREAAPPAERITQLIAARARNALPGVAKRVVADWTETVLRSSRDRRSRQSESASRVEVGRGGAPAPVSLKPRGVDYTRMSDEEILNME